MFDFNLFLYDDPGDEDLNVVEMFVEILKAIWAFLRDAFSGFNGSTEE